VAEVRQVTIGMLMLDGLKPWTLTVRSSWTGEVTLIASEVRDLCAAIELDRVTREDVVALLTRRRQRRERLEWGDLMGGANGLQRKDAPGRLTVPEAFARVGFEILRFEVKP
jgi:hypothetical protein